MVGTAAPWTVPVTSARLATKRRSAQGGGSAVQTWNYAPALVPKAGNVRQKLPLATHLLLPGHRDPADGRGLGDPVRAGVGQRARQERRSARPGPDVGVGALPRPPAAGRRCWARDRAVDRA